MWLPYCRHHHHEPEALAAALEVRALAVTYPGGRSPAIADVSFRVRQGARVGLVGANGSGKSTLLKTVAGLLMPCAGTVLTFGLPLESCHHRIAYLPQRTDLDWRFPISARRLVLTGRYVHLGWLKRPGPTDWLRTDETLRRLGMADLAECQIGQLSGGQQQRLLLARALAQEADLFLLDEPLNAVDADTARWSPTSSPACNALGRPRSSPPTIWGGSKPSSMTRSF